MGDKSGSGGNCTLYLESVFARTFCTWHFRGTERQQHKDNQWKELVHDRHPVYSGKRKVCWRFIDSENVHERCFESSAGREQWGAAAILHSEPSRGHHQQGRLDRGAEKDMQQGAEAQGVQHGATVHFGRKQDVVLKYIVNDLF